MSATSPMAEKAPRRKSRFTYGSVCSGIEAASVAWEPLGWTPAWFAEIDPFASAVLKHRYPSVPNLGDFTKIGREHGPIDLLVGGTPCTDYSVAGEREGLEGADGQLALEYVALLGRLRPRWMVFENVPGLLSSNDGRDFGAFLGALGQLGYGFAYRVLGAQYFGLAQRRKRVFVVGCLGDWRAPAAVLIERQSLLRLPPPRRRVGTIDPAEDADGAGAAEPALAFTFKDSGQDITVDLSPTLQTGTSSKKPGGAGNVAVIAFHAQAGTHSPSVGIEVAPTLKTGSGSNAGNQVAIVDGWVARRLTPLECERVQGFPDNWTQVPYRGKPAPETHRYITVANSIATSVMAWIGERIEAVEELLRQREVAA